MASTPTTRLRCEKQALGENSATWGAPKLNDVIDRLDEAIAGVESIAIAGTTTTLSSANYSTDQARKACLIFTGTLSANSNVIVPNVEKLYLLVNNTTGSYSLTAKTSGGTGYALRSGPNWVYCDATNVTGAVPRLDQLPLATATVDVNSQRIANLGTPSASTDAATKAYVDAAVSTTPTQNLASSDGTALAPTYSWASDSNTGLYRVSADSLGITAGGVVRATVSSTGLAVAGTLSASGATTLSSTLGVTGATTLSSTLAVTSGATVGGTLGVTGAATFSSTLGAGALTATSVTSSGAISGTTLAASGAATLSSTLGVTGAATLSSTLAVTSSATIGGTLGVTGAIAATGGMTASAPVLTAAGTAGAPSHSFSGDPDTGMRNGGTNTLTFSTGGSDRFSIDSAGILRAANNIYWETGTNRSVGYKALVDHANGNVGETIFGCYDGNDWCGMAVKNVDAGTYNNQTLAFRTATGGSTLATDRLTISDTGILTIPKTGGSHLILNELATTTIQAVQFQMVGVAKGNIDISTTGVTYNTASDYRLKEDIVPLTDALDLISGLSPKRFKFISDPSHTVMDGFLAHELAQVVPAAVSGEKDAVYGNGQPMYQSVDASRLVPLLVAAVQELTRRVEALEDAV